MIDAAGICGKIHEHGLIAILRNVPPERLMPIAEALYLGGVRLIECTFDHSRADGIASNAAMIRDLAEGMRGRMEVGAGTVLSRAEVEATIEAGGSFIISPGADAVIIRATREMGAVSIPGALTPTEIAMAHDAGAHFVKIFPAGSMGAEYIKAIRAPLRHVPMLAVGGINPSDIADYMGAGIIGFGVGSPLLPARDIERGNYSAVTERAQAFTDMIARARKEFKSKH